jgi:hypothetical protein
MAAVCCFTGELRSEKGEEEEGTNLEEDFERTEERDHHDEREEGGVGDMDIDREGVNW